jgi:hypothetical protein
VLELEAVRALESTRDLPVDQLPVVGVHSGEVPLVRRLELVRFDSPDPVQLVRPRHAVGGHVPLPTADAGDPLCLDQPLLALAQHLLVVDALYGPAHLCADEADNTEHALVGWLDSGGVELEDGGGLTSNEDRDAEARRQAAAQRTRRAGEVRVVAEIGDPRRLAVRQDAAGHADAPRETHLLAGFAEGGEPVRILEMPHPERDQAVRVIGGTDQRVTDRPSGVRADARQRAVHGVRDVGGLVRVRRHCAEQLGHLGRAGQLLDGLVQLARRPLRNGLCLEPCPALPDQAPLQRPHPRCVR